MIVKGGATLKQRLDDGSVVRALAMKHYTDVVLQERGGDLMCSFGPSSCTDSREAIHAIVSAARRVGARTYLLGSYQNSPAASKAIVAAESTAAAEAGIPYLEVSQKLQTLRVNQPALNWLAPDGMHPGPSLALLNATVLHQALFEISPQPNALKVNAPIYGTTSGLAETVRRAEDPPPLETTPRGIDYPATSLQILLHSINAGTGS